MYRSKYMNAYFILVAISSSFHDSKFAFFVRGLHHISNFTIYMKL